MPRTKQQFGDMRAKSRTMIMEAALELFSADGYSNTPISKIAKKAGVSTGLMYNYFASKEALLEAIFRGGLNMVQEMMGDILKVKDPRAKLKMMIDESFRVAGGEDEQFWKLYFNLAMQPNLPDNIFLIFGKIIHGAFDYIAGVFAELGYENPEMEARIFSALGDGIMLHYWMIGDHYQLEKVVQYLHKMYNTDNHR